MSSRSTEPPQPPKVRPRLQMHRSDLTGAVVFAGITLLAVMGAFGPSISRIESQSGAVEVSVEHPSLLRYAMLSRIDAWITNSGADPIAEVGVTFDSEYVHAFSTVAFTPEPEEAYVVTLRDIAPGETRLVSLAANAERLGIINGGISITTGRQSVRLHLRTVILP